MNGDFTRIPYDLTKGYTRVLKQQGRVDLDADWNEHAAIQDYIERTENVDIIGHCGVPKEGGGFAIGLTGDGSDLTISAGRIYVDGLLVTLDEDTSYAGQVPAPVPLNQEADQTDLVYIDVWQRHVTAVEDPSIREVALGGPDTTTRLQTVWRVHTQRVEAGTTCDTLGDWTPATSGGKLTTGVSTAPPTTEPCDLTPAGGFRGLENQLYRVEIHDAGDIDDTATFKWSRDNGSVVYAIDEFVDGQPTDHIKLKSLGRDEVLTLKVDDWVEIIDDDTEMAGGPGMMAQVAEPPDEANRVITLDRDVSGFDLGKHPKVRRWDHSDSEVLPVTAGTIELEDGVEIEFSGNEFQTGDYWSFAARTNTADVDRLTEEPPFGINHHYCALALVTWRPTPDETWTADMDDCRPYFPSLTNICAEDVCFDNEHCGAPGAETVQDALDWLCERNDLPHHNKHLHGWGIVCGLQVVCGPDDDDDEVRRNVTVRDGYALDCEGNDVILEQSRTIDMLEAIRRYTQETDQQLIDDNGDGDVCLILETDPQRPFSIEPHDPHADNDLQSLLAGTLLMDFYEDCIERLVDFVRDEFTVPDEGEERPAGPVEERLAAFTNLLAMPVNPETGQHIFVSRREHTIMLDFYTRLRALLQSQTYCGMFDNARPFPDYPEEFDESGMDTIFGKGFHTRLRLRPNSDEAYTVGAGINPLEPSTIINRYRVAGEPDERRLISQIDPLAGAEETQIKGDSGSGAVQDVAFSEDGTRIYVIVSSRDDENTFFRAGTFRGDEINWDRLVTICGVKLVTLATTPADAKSVYAVGMKKVTITDENGNETVEFRGTGLYRINPDNVDSDMEPLVAFNAGGHLRITDDGRAYATAGPDDARFRPYDRVVAVNVPAGDSWLDGPIMLDASGEDDIAVVAGTNRDVQVLYSVVESAEQNGKRIVAHDANSGSPLKVSVPVADTTIRLEHFAPTDALLISSADGYNVQILDVTQNAFDPEYLLPMQVGPSSMAVNDDATVPAAYVLNTGSNTIITAENPEVFRPEYRFPLDLLAQYRADVINAFTDLLGGLLQYLKDCLCDHFLVNCPECDGDEKMYLACVSIRGGQVERVCNFSKRKYVKSFPTIGYWLSLVPIVPFVDWAIEQFCCIALPELFGRYTAQPTEARYTSTYQPRVSTASLYQGAAFVRGFDLMSQLGEFRLKGSRVQSVAMDRLSVSRMLERAEPAPTKRVTSLVDQPADAIEADLVERGVTVHRQPYDASKVSNVTSFFRTPRPGAEVTIYEEKGHVKYYEVTQPAARPAPEAPTDLQTRVHELSTALEAKDAELADLRTQLQTLSQKQTELETKAPASDEVATMKAELEELRSFRSEVQKFMKESRG